MVARRWGECCGGAIVREFGMDVYTLLFLKWIINRVLLYSTWNSAQYYITTKWGKNFKKARFIYMYN